MAGMAIHLFAIELGQMALVAPIAFDPTSPEPVRLDNIILQIGYRARLIMLLKVWQTPA
jgi:hypothetical protein